MKINKLCVALLVSSVVVAPAFADETSNVAITAEVPTNCEFRPSETGGVDPSTPIKLTVANNGIHGGVTEADTTTTRTMHLSCNQPFVVHLESDQGAVRRLSLANGGSAVDTAILGGTMAKAIGYSAAPRLTNIDSALFTPTYTTLTANADLMSGTPPETKVQAMNVVRTDAGGDNSGGAYDGALEIAIVTETSPMLVAGSYRDTLRVILTAQ